MPQTTPEKLIGELELTRGLTIQMTAIGTLGMIVGWTFFSGLYQLTTEQAIAIQPTVPGTNWNPIVWPVPNWYRPLKSVQPTTIPRAPIAVIWIVNPRVSSSSPTM